MKEIRKVALAGLGALGCVYAVRLRASPAGEDFRVIMNGERIERYRRDGLYFNDARTEFTPSLPDEGTGDADLIIVAVKYRELPQALEDIRLYVGPDTRILLLLNGLVSEEMAAAIYGWNRVLYSMSVSVDARKEGNRVISTTPGFIHFGEAKNDPPSPEVLAVKALFDRADIPTRVPADMVRTLWWKLMVNVGMNQTSAILDASFGAFQTKESPARNIMLAAQREVVRVARAAGVDLSERDVDDWLPLLYQLSPDGITSMVQDMRAGRKTEVDYMGGTVAEYGRRHGVETPVNDLLVQIIHGLETASDTR